MEEKNKIIVKWAQENVETSNSLLNNNNMPLLCAQWKTADDGQRNCPKHVEFYSKNKFGKISASGWFYYKNLSRCRLPERQIHHM